MAQAIIKTKTQQRAAGSMGCVSQRIYLVQDRAGLVAWLVLRRPPVGEGVCARGVQGRILYKYHQWF